MISVSFLGHCLCDALSHWEPLGATRVPILPPRRRSRQTSPIKAPSTSYTHHPPSDLEQSSHIQTSRLTLGTQSPWSCWGGRRGRQGKIVSWLLVRKRVGDKKKKGRGGFLKYLIGKRSRRNEVVLFCFIFDADKLQSYTGLPFKSQRCHTEWEFRQAPRMTFSRRLRLGRLRGGMFTWRLLVREESHLCGKFLFNSKECSLLTFKCADMDLYCLSDCRVLK